MKRLILATILAGLLVTACGHKTTVPTPTTTENVTTVTQVTALTADQEAFVQSVMTKTGFTHEYVVALATQYDCWTMEEALKSPLAPALD